MIQSAQFGTILYGGPIYHCTKTPTCTVIEFYRSVAFQFQLTVPVVGLITMQTLMCSMSEPESPGEWYPDMRESFRDDVYAEGDNC